MKIISNPDFDYEEQVTTINDISVGDVFRLANMSYVNAISNGGFYIYTSTIFVGVNLSTGITTQFEPSKKIIVHEASTVIIPNT